MPLLTLTELRDNLSKVIDQVIETGIPVEVQRNGHKIKIILADGPSKFDRLTYRPNVINGDPDSIVHCEWNVNSEDDWISLDNLLSSNPKYRSPGFALKGARLKEGYTQARLAKLLNIRQEELSKMEHDKRKLTEDMSKRIAKVLNIDYRVFFDAEKD